LLLLLLGSVLSLVGLSVGPEVGTLGMIIHYVTIPIGYAGLVLTGIGALGLLVWRVTDRNQRPYNAPAEYFNLIFFDLVIAVALIAQLIADPGFIVVRQYMASLVTFSAPPALSGWLTAEIVLVSLIIMYVPISRMSHFVAKYFLYHSVRWNDEANMRGSKIEKRILELLNNKVGWSAPHIQTGQPWAKVVKETENEQE
jgi:nitrate reductase gamma subunit